MMRKIYIFFILIAQLSLFDAFAVAQGQGVSKSERADALEQALSSLDKAEASGGGQEGASVQSAPVSFRQVTAIEIIGNKTVSSNTVISKMKTRVGAPYQDTVISDDLKRLYLLGFFSDIKVDTVDYEDGVKVIITVAERPVIEKILFSGIRRLRMSEDKLKASLKSKESQYLDYPNLTEDARAIKKMYEKMGFSAAAVEYTVDTNKSTQRAKVLFTVTEGKRVRVRDILVEGNRYYPAKRILKLMKTKRAWLLNPGVLKEEVFAEDINRIRTFYRKNGFSDIIVDYEVKTDPTRPFLYITIKLQEGKRYLVGSVTVKGNKEISEREILLKLTECIPHKVFSEDALKADIANIQGLYFDHGYIFAQVQEATSVNPDTGRVEVVYNITENNLAYVDKIKIRGNVKTKDLVIRRELRIRPGDRFDGEKLRRSKERLQNLGFFEEVSYDTEEGSAPDRKDLVVDVKESKTGAFSFGGGYSTVDQFVGFVEIEQKNFDWKNFPYFTGAGQDLKLRASFGTVSSGYDLSFTEPWLFDYPISFGFDLYQRGHKREEDTGYGYDEEVTGGDLRLGKEISEYVKANAMYRYDTIKIANITDNATSDLKQEDGTNAISSLELGLTYDDRNNVFDPVKGNLLSGSVETAGGPFSGDKDYVKFFGRASHYFPLVANSALEFRVRAGLAHPYGDSPTIPIYERFFVGGAYTVRGYDERKIGPIDKASKDPLGGGSMLVGNVEYTYPIIGFLKLAAFYDIGNAWPKASDIASGGMKAGVGFGFRLKTPIGPIMLDYGLPLDKAPGEDQKGDGKVHFSMSHGF